MLGKHSQTPKSNSDNQMNTHTRSSLQKNIGHRQAGSRSASQSQCLRVCTQNVVPGSATELRDLGYLSRAASGAAGSACVWGWGDAEYWQSIRGANHNIATAIDHRAAQEFRTLIRGMHLSNNKNSVWTFSWYRRCLKKVRSSRRDHHRA
ncbi:hypothetical protein lerEdw1_018561 [Lerista edwardsae]|nr:hypothetical protein lerEdw1_018561 [Lerista edwardsae]